MKRALILIIVAFQFATAFVILRDSQTDNEGEISPHFSFVVESDGKSFFVERRHSGYGGWTWEEASSFCESSGMRLASITSDNQFNALNNANITTDFGNIAGFWTSGRDSHILNQFRWNETDTELSETLPLLNWYNLEYQTCVGFGKRYNESFLYFQDCSVKQLGIMCETSDSLQ